MDAVIRPYGTLDFLTQREISELSGPEEGYLKKLFHRHIKTHPWIFNQAGAHDSIVKITRVCE